MPQTLLKCTGWFFVLFVIVFTNNAYAIENAGLQDTELMKIITGDVKRLPSQVLTEAERTYFDSKNLTLLLMAGGGSIALHDKADDKIADHFDRHGKMSKDMDLLIDWTGSPATHIGAAAIWYAMAANDQNEFGKARAWTMIKALSLTGATTLILKGINNNHTPNGKSLAWPSGHTSSSFCVAAVLDEFYGPKVGIPAYGLAGLVGYRMMESGDHWASDVLFGAVLGYVIGHSVAGEHKKLEIAGFDILPYNSFAGSKPVTGIMLAKQF